MWCGRVEVFVVIPEAAKRLPGIHNPGERYTEMPGLWIPGSRLQRAPERPT
jgi:hypothetical protein